MSDVYIKFKSQESMEKFCRELTLTMSSLTPFQSYIIRDDVDEAFVATHTYSTIYLSSTYDLTNKHFSIEKHAVPQLVRVYQNFTPANIYVVIDSAVQSKNHLSAMLTGIVPTWSHGLGESTTNTVPKCSHQYVNISFAGIKMACKLCGENQ